MAFRFGDRAAKDARRRVIALAQAHWHAIGWPQSQRLEAELRRELSLSHDMHAGTWKAVARASDSEDVLILATDCRAAIVRLTWLKQSNLS